MSNKTLIQWFSLDVTTGSPLVLDCQEVSWRLNDITSFPWPKSKYFFLICGIRWSFFHSTLYSPFFVFTPCIIFSSLVAQWPASYHPLVDLLTACSSSMVLCHNFFNFKIRPMPFFPKFWFFRPISLETKWLDCRIIISVQGRTTSTTMGMNRDSRLSIYRRSPVKSPDIKTL